MAGQSFARGWRVDSDLRYRDAILYPVFLLSEEEQKWYPGRDLNPHVLTDRGF